MVTNCTMYYILHCRLKIPQLDGTVILPTTEAMTVLVPPQQIDNLDDYDPFTSNIPTITGISDQVQVIASLQKPRKIMLIASDGERYPFLCKPEDDLRKDMRVMDVNTIMNKLLKKDPDARERHLHIRTYGIVPLNEKCGLIEWVRCTFFFFFEIPKEAYMGKIFHPIC